MNMDFEMFYNTKSETRKKQKAVIIDIDNCWMDSRAIPMYAEENPTEYAELLRTQCIPNVKFIRDVTEFIEENDLFPIFLTGRTGSKEIADVTRKQIEENSKFTNDMHTLGTWYILYMREPGDMTPTPTMKTQVIGKKILEHYNVVAAIDDDIKNLEKFKKFFSFDCYHYSIVNDTISKVRIYNVKHINF